MDTSAHNLTVTEAAERLIAAHDGDVCLLYIWLRRRGKTDLDAAARELCRTGAEMQAAYEKLVRLGLAQEKPRQEIRRTDPELPEELPEYSTEDIDRSCRENGDFGMLVNETRRILDKCSLSGAELNTLFGIYDYLAMPPEIILTLVNYCAELFAEKYGPGRRPSMRVIQENAFKWARNEIFTLEQAEAFIRRAKEQRETGRQIKAALGIRDRNLSPSEQKYIASWLDMGFDVEAILLAYDRTVTNTGSLKWSYMNRILQSWHEKDLHTVQLIQAQDPKAARRSGSRRESVDKNELARLQAIYEKVKEG